MSRYNVDNIPFPVKMAKTPEELHNEFGYWQYRITGTHRWTNARSKARPFYNARLYYKRGEYYTYISHNIEWRYKTID